MVKRTDDCVIQSCNKKRRILWETYCDGIDRLNRLTDDLLIQVLVRLPAKLVYQCNTVCKRWRSLIWTGYFVNCYTEHYSEKNNKSNDYRCTLLFQHFMCLQHGVSTQYLSFNTSSGCVIRREDIDFGPGAIVKASSHDLLLCYDQRGVYSVINWETKQTTILPCVGHAFQSDIHFQGLVCNRDLKDDMMSNGFRFKVMLVSPPKEETRSRKFRVRIFCSKTRRWSKAKVRWYHCSPARLICSSSSIISHNGKLHWINGRYLFSLDLLNGDQRRLKLSRVKLPDGLIFRDGSIFGVCRDRFRFAQYGPANVHRELAVWELVDYDKVAWQLVSRTSSNDHPVLIMRWYELYKLHGFDPDDPDMIFMQRGDYVCHFNIKTNCVRWFREDLNYHSRSAEFRKSVHLLMSHCCFPTPVFSPTTS